MLARSKRPRIAELMATGLAAMTTLSLFSASGWAEPCAPVFEGEAGVTKKARFDPISDTPRLYNILKLRNPESRGCSARLTFSVRSFSHNWPKTAALVIRDQSGRSLLEERPGEGGSERDNVRLTLSPDVAESWPMTFDLENSGPLLRPGQYAAELEISLWPSGQGQGTAFDHQDLTLRFEIESSVRLAIAESAPGTTVSLGELQPGKRQGLALLVTSNAPYSFSVSSQNDWTLRRLGGTGRLDERVPYRLTLDGFEAGSDPDFAKDYERVAEGTRAHNLEITTGAFEYIRHGRYEDIITLLVGARH